MHRDGIYRVLEIRGSDSKTCYEDRNKDAAVEHYLLTDRKLVMEAMGVAYPDGTEEREGT